MCFCSGPCTIAYIFISVDYQQAQDIAYSLCWMMWVQRRRHRSGIGPALDRVSRLMRFMCC